MYKHIQEDMSHPRSDAVGYMSQEDMSHPRSEEDQGCGEL